MSQWYRIPLQCRSCRWHWDFWIGKIPWRRAWQLTLVFLLGESHGQRSLAGYMTERLSSHIHTQKNPRAIGVVYTALHSPSLVYNFSIPTTPTHVTVQFYQTNNCLASPCIYVPSSLSFFLCQRYSPFVLLFTWNISSHPSLPNILSCLPDPKGRPRLLRLSQHLHPPMYDHTSI